jgi:hypothetical protein
MHAKLFAHLTVCGTVHSVGLSDGPPRYNEGCNRCGSAPHVIFEVSGLEDAEWEGEGWRQWRRRDELPLEVCECGD